MNVRSSVELYEELLKLQNIKEGKKVVIVSEQQYARLHEVVLDHHQASLANIGTDFYTMIIPPKNEEYISGQTRHQFHL